MLLFATTAIAEQITIEGTIEGLLMTLNDKKCEPGMEHIVAAVENQFVLVDAKGNWYVLPQFKPNQVAPYVGKRVKVIGELVGKGKAIQVKSAYVFEADQWKAVYDEESLKEQKKLEEAILNAPT